jgi:hypothetical protein
MTSKSPLKTSSTHQISADVISTQPLSKEGYRTIIDGNESGIYRKTGKKPILPIKVDVKHKLPFVVGFMWTSTNAMEDGKAFTNHKLIKEGKMLAHTHHIKAFCNITSAFCTLTECFKASNQRICQHRQDRRYGGKIQAKTAPKSTPKMTQQTVTLNESIHIKKPAKKASFDIKRAPSAPTNQRTDYTDTGERLTVKDTNENHGNQSKKTYADAVRAFAVETTMRKRKHPQRRNASKLLDRRTQDLGGVL